ncbi:MAG: hypothetical protein WEE89_14640, partial [Gemmatimonadota bacterium]
MAEVNVIAEVAARVEALLVQRLGPDAPEPDIVPAAPIPASTEAVLALRNAVAGSLDGYDLSTLAETLEALVAAASLDAADRYVLTLLALANLDDRIGRAIGLLHDDVSRTRPSVGLIARILEPLTGRAAALEAAAPNGTLAQRGMIDHVGAYADADAPFANQELVLHPRIMAVLISGGPLNSPEPQLAGALMLERTSTLDEAEDPELFERRESNALAYRLADLPRTGRAVGLLSVGPDLEATLDVAREFARRERMRVLRVDLTSAFALGATAESLVRVVRRESIALHALPVWTGLPPRDALADPELTKRIARMLMAAPAPLLVHADQLWTPPAELPLTLIHYAAPAPTFRDRVALWQHDDGTTRPASEATAQQLATAFVLPPLAVQAARAEADAAVTVLGGELPEQLRRAAHRQSAARLVRFATKITPRAEWKHLVVPPNIKQQLREVEWRVAHRHRVLEQAGFSGHRGFLALFVGASGTGKKQA